MGLNLDRLGAQARVGLVVVALSPIGCIVLFALVASIIGEDHLAGPKSVPAGCRWRASWSGRC